MSEGNLVRWIKDCAEGEPIIGVVIGEMPWGDYNSDNVPNYEKQPKGKLIDWNLAKKILNYKFDDGFGAPSCNAIYAWTENKVIFVSQYDGATRPCVIPRNPTDCMPKMPGGG